MLNYRSNCKVLDWTETTQILPTGLQQQLIKYTEDFPAICYIFMVGMQIMTVQMQHRLSFVMCRLSMWSLCENYYIKPIIYYV